MPSVSMRVEAEVRQGELVITLRPGSVEVQITGPRGGQGPLVRMSHEQWDDIVDAVTRAKAGVSASAVAGLIESPAGGA